jgi:hypothetical protein
LVPSLEDVMPYQLFVLPTEVSSVQVACMRLADFSGVGAGLFSGVTLDLAVFDFTDAWRVGACALKSADRTRR